MRRPRSDTDEAGILEDAQDDILALQRRFELRPLPVLEYDAPSSPALDTAPFPLYLTAEVGRRVYGVLVLDATTNAAASVSWRPAADGRVEVRAIYGVPSGRQTVRLGALYG